MVDSRAQELLEVIGRIKNLAHKSRPYASIPHGEFFLLTCIDAHMQKESLKGNQTIGVKVSELSKYTHASAPATSKAIRLLEGKKLIERIADNNDRRVVYIALTDEGREILKNSKEKFENLVNRLVGKLGTEDTDHLIRISKSLYEIIQEEFQNNKQDEKLEND